VGGFAARGAARAAEVTVGFRLSTLQLCGVKAQGVRGRGIPPLAKNANDGAPDLTQAKGGLEWGTWPLPWEEVKIPTPSASLRAGSAAKNAAKVGHPRSNLGSRESEKNGLPGGRGISSRGPGNGMDVAAQTWGTRFSASGSEKK
jgi:hypothetical protein